MSRRPRRRKKGKIIDEPYREPTMITYILPPPRKIKEPGAPETTSFSVTLPVGLVNWLDQKVKEKAFKDRNYGIECALKKLKESMHATEDQGRTN